jgi:hypothetical protein
MVFRVSSNDAASLAPNFIRSRLPSWLASRRFERG